MISSLMYHAVTSAKTASGSWDPHYAVDAGAFHAQVAALQAAGLRVTSVRATLDAPPGPNTERPNVCLTFDDGTHTDADVAWPILSSFGATADFFVNPSTVGTSGFVTWAQLRQMADAGMSVQSHGQSHRFLDDLPEGQLHEELHASKSEIEARIGRQVSLLAPPGGRLTNRAIGIALGLGYEAICSSRPGRWALGDGPVLPRIAVLASHDTSRVVDFGLGKPSAVAPLVARYATAWGVKKVLGNGRYVKLRERLLNSAKATRNA